MTQAVPGYKAIVSASTSTGGAKTRIAELQDVSWEDTHGTFDATSHDSSGERERIGGITDFEAAISGLWKDDDATQVALFDAINNRTRVDVELQPAGSSGANLWQRSGFVSKWSIGGPAEGAAVFSAGVVGSGASVASSSGGALTVHFEDSFTDADGTAPADHAPDTPATTDTWDLGENAAYTIQSNKCEGVLGVGGGWVKYGQPIGIHDNFDVFADIHRPTDVQTLQKARIIFRCSSGGVFGSRTEHQVMMENASSSEAGIRLFTVENGVNRFDQLMSSQIPWQRGETLRMGATVNGDQVKAWWEPEGGGARTQVGATTWAAGFVLNSSDNQWVGEFHERTGTDEILYDNLTVTDSS